MIVGLLASSRTSGGGSVLRERLASALLSSGDVERLVVFTDPSDGPPQPSGTNGRLCLERVDGTGGLVRVAARQAQSVRKAARRHRMDVLLCPGNQVAPAGGVPRLMWPVTVGPFDPLMRTTVTRRLRRRQRASVSARLRLQALLIKTACKQADGLMFPSRYALRLYERWGAVGTTPSAVIPPAPGLPEGGFPPDPHAFTDRPWGEQKYFLFVSHLYPYKMAIELVEGFGRFLSRVREPHHLVIAGAAPDRRYLESIKQTLTRERLGDTVHMLGSVSPETLSQLYRRATSFVLPSLCEIFGSFPLLDALAHGRPVLSSCLSAMPEAGGDAALYFDPRDPEAIAQRMLQVANDDALADDLARRSRERAAELPGWDDVARGVVSFAQRWC
ncbi:MAG: glycosyltransferase family 4 protein [Actinomycetota bacterium]|nr:glycosyltransferase family 4 protein [Actinomycetota bacterium]